jgi:NTP pyrophosphatase (non-canonical NTP hydrolase)
MELRESVRLFAEAMETKLRENDHKGHWGDCDPRWLLARLDEERGELIDTVFVRLRQQKDGLDWPESAESILREAADVANFAMMVADVCGGLRRDQ